MLFNTTDTNKDYIKESDEMLSKAFSWFDKIKMGAAGSGKLVIEEFSPKMQSENLISSAVFYAKVELRPKGIIVHFTNGLDRYSWTIPYYRLLVYNFQNFTIHANGHFIKFKKDKNYKDNKKFIEKMIDLKNDFLDLGYYDG